ncbi:MAG: hypothetical protein V9G12_02130 [Microthrixaceae bacterium]
MAGEFCTAVQWGYFTPRISKPRPHGLGSWRPKPGKTPASPVNCSVVASAIVLSCSRRPGASNSDAHDARVAHRGRGARRRRAVERRRCHPEGREHALDEVLGGREAGRRGQVLGEDLEAPVGVDATLAGRSEDRVVVGSQTRRVREQMAHCRARWSAGSVEVDRTLLVREQGGRGDQRLGDRGEGEPVVEVAGRRQDSAGTHGGDAHVGRRPPFDERRLLGRLPGRCGSWFLHRPSVAHLPGGR